MIHSTVGYKLHSQKEDYLLFVALALSDDKEGARSFTAEMHVHSCILSVSMHIETMSLTQNIIHLLSV